MEDLLGRRRERRFFKRFQVSYGVLSPSTTGFTKNVSKSGLFIQTYRPIAMGNDVLVSVALNDKSIITMKARVKWHLAIRPEIDSLIEAGMGLEIVRSDPLFEQIVNEIERREYKTDATIPRVLSFEFRSIDLLIDEFMTNIKDGGLFIETKIVFPFQHQLSVLLILPNGIEKIELNCEVVCNLDEHNAHLMGAKQGVGLKILTPSDLVDKMFYDYFNRVGVDPTSGGIL